MIAVATVNNPCVFPLHCLANKGSDCPTKTFGHEAQVQKLETKGSETGDGLDGFHAGFGGLNVAFGN